MNTTMIGHLVRKDWYFQRGPIAAGLALGLLSLGMLLSSSQGVFYLGAVLLLTVVISIGIFLTFLTVVQERTQGMLPFVMSLPIGVREYTAAKLAANLLLFLTPWLMLGAGATAVILLRESVPDGVLPFTIALLLYVLCGYIVTLATAIVTDSEAWTIAVMATINLGLQAYIYWSLRLADVAATISGPTVAWVPSLRTIAAVELGVVALVLVATWQWQSRRKDFL
ncbi:MAG: ABC-2 transporter permease [Gemmatimonadales bacterium]|nr:ABC-2 transporter permease [Gemmatimonadota bacterium]MBP6442447.1 ABC-2 transporter permease [Gemmatimonadales bacterium]MBP6570240.1 ABC-2 transporter permease [Gemmatimonadales bacterium]MBP7619587.1 ABC-2 transporter permease [Gemmatimonadales bacterium]MBP9897521.1 ABC-2 transporter permease [Gemmatimonadales bacterium]